MSPKYQIIILLFTIALVAAQCVGNAMPSTDHASHPKGLVITNAVARISGNNGVVYFDILNNSEQTDAIIKVGTDIATAEMHETTIDADQVMHMQPTPKVDLPVGETVNFKPGGKHIMLIDVKQDLTPSDKVKLTLTFEHAAPMSLDIALSDGPTGHDNGMEHKMDGEHSMDMPKKE